MKMEQGYCFVWNEPEGGLNSEEFATIMSKFIVKEVIPQRDEKDRYVVFYTDGCTYQNRNVVLSNAYINVSIYYNITITHKYLEVGHTQMEVDSMHAMIEKRQKNQTIHAPAKYLNICRTAKTNNKKYQYEYLTFPYFKDFKQIAFYKSIRSGKIKRDLKVTDLRALQYRHNGDVMYKLRFGEEWKILNQRKTQVVPVRVEDIKNLYDERRIITKIHHKTQQLLFYFTSKEVRKKIF